LVPSAEARRLDDVIITLSVPIFNGVLGQAQLRGGTARGTLDYGGFIERDEFEHALLGVKA
jgi:hypothetical protein